MYNFNNKTFILQENTDNGKVTEESLFRYSQTGDQVTATYSGGTIRYGKIIARLENDILHMLYQCLTTDNELKAGKAIAHISTKNDDTLQLSLDWEWLEGDNATGKSVYVEV